MDRPIIAEGSRVRLVPLTEEDVQWLWKTYNDRRVSRPALNTGVFSLEDEKKFVEGSYNKRKPSLLIVTKSGERVGVVGVNEYSENSRRMEIGYWIAPEHWGNGYATEAVSLFVDFLFREYGINKVEAKTLATNVASQRVLEKNGFKLEGRLRKHSWDRNRGCFEDLLVYGLLREEWEGRK